MNTGRPTAPVLRTPMLLLAVLAAAATLVYANHFDNGFHFDDSHAIEENAYLRSLSNVPLFFVDATTQSALPSNQTYRPLVMSTLAIDYALGNGYDPFWFHFTSFSMFILQGLGMWLLYATIFDRARQHRWNGTIAAVAVGAYWLHTANAETVNYILARTDILSTLFVVGAFVVELKARGRWRHSAWLLMAVGALAKPTALMYVPQLFVYRVLFERGLGINALMHADGRRALVGETLRILPGAAIAILVYIFIAAMTADTWTPGGTSAWHYAITQPFVMLRYFWIFFLPLGLSADTDWAVLDSIADARFWIGTAFLLLSLWAFGAASNRTALRPIAFGLAWFFTALAPTSTVIPLAEVTNDHRMYFPFVGLTLAAAWVVALILQRCEAKQKLSRGAWLTIWVAVVAVLAAHGTGVYERNKVWQDAASLWQDVTVKSPRNGRGLMNYGLTRMATGDYEGALALFERARNTAYGNHPYLHINIAITRNELGQRLAADQAFQLALETGSDYPDTHYFFGRHLWERGRRMEARDAMRRALALAPAHAPAREWLAWIDEQLASGAAAAANVTDTAAAEHQLDLSLALYDAGRFEESAAAARAAITLNENYALAWNNLCAAHNALSRYDAAVAACERALAIDPRLAIARNNLAWARNQAGGLRRTE